MHFIISCCQCLVRWLPQITQYSQLRNEKTFIIKINCAWAWTQIFKNILQCLWMKTRLCFIMKSIMREIEYSQHLIGCSYWGWVLIGSRKSFHGWNLRSCFVEQVYFHLEWLSVDWLQVCLISSRKIILQLFANLIFSHFTDQAKCLIGNLETMLHCFSPFPDRPCIPEPCRLKHNSNNFHGHWDTLKNKTAIGTTT